MVSSDEIGKKLENKRNGDSDELVCPKCGTGNKSDSTYCLECGGTLTSDKKVEETPIKNETSFLRKIPGFRSWTPWKMISSSIIYLIVLIMIITFAGGAASTIGTNNTTVSNNNVTYNNNNISFVYPSDWNLDNLTGDEKSNGEIVSVGTGTNVVTTTTTSNITNSTNTSTSETDNCFFVSRNSSTISADDMNTEINAIVADPTNNQYLHTISSATNVTANKITIDGVNASEITSISSDDQGASWKEIDIYFLKNGYIYTLTFQSTPPGNFNENNYQRIINSFHVD